MDPRVEFFADLDGAMNRGDEAFSCACTSRTIKREAEPFIVGCSRCRIRMKIMPQIWPSFAPPGEETAALTIETRWI